MAKFIPIDKLKQLREASRNGDENAKKILAMQLNGKEDFNPLLDQYFQPKQEPQPIATAQVSEAPTGAAPTQQVAQPNQSVKNSRLQEFLQFNGITKENSEYGSFVEDFYKENPNEPREEEVPECKELIQKLIKEESDAIDSYSKGVVQIMNSSELNDDQKRKLISRLKEIRGDEEMHFKELSELLPIFEEKIRRNC